jgi:hypothetical protein
MRASSGLRSWQVSRSAVSKRVLTSVSACSRKTGKGFGGTTEGSKPANRLTI